MGTLACEETHLFSAPVYALLGKDSSPRKQTGSPVSCYPLQKWRKLIVIVSLMLQAHMGIFSNICHTKIPVVFSHLNDPIDKSKSAGQNKKKINILNNELVNIYIYIYI